MSGGGTRAAAFHLGVLRRLADDGRLEDVSAISTVSGGSLIMAAILARPAGAWPSCARFLSDVYPDLRRLITTTDLFSCSALGWRGVVRHGAAVLADRAGLLARLLEERWQVGGALRDLPDSPVC